MRGLGLDRYCYMYMSYLFWFCAFRPSWVSPFFFGSWALALCVKLLGLRRTSYTAFCLHDLPCCCSHKRASPRVLATPCWCVVLLASLSVHRKIMVPEDSVSVTLTPNVKFVVACCGSVASMDCAHDGDLGQLQDWSCGVLYTDSSRAGNLWDSHCCLSLTHLVYYT